MFRSRDAGDDAVNGSCDQVVGEIGAFSRRIATKVVLWIVAPRRMARVLLVDDDPDIRETLGVLLEAAGHDTYLAASGPEALAIVGAQPIDVAVVDLMMPEMDGASLVRELCARGWHAPVVLISAGGDVERVARTLGVYAYLAKPFRIEALEDLIASAVASGAASPTGAFPADESGSGLRTRDPKLGKANGDG
jgi:CheY-like chemotaxis protein